MCIQAVCSVLVFGAVQPVLTCAKRFVDGQHRPWLELYVLGAHTLWHCRGHGERGVVTPKPNYPRLGAALPEMLDNDRE